MKACRLKPFLPKAACLMAAACIWVATFAADTQMPGGAAAIGGNAPTTSISPYQPDRFAGKAGRYYSGAWGIESLSVKLVESGELIRFSWRVIDPAKAAPLNDKRLKPQLIDQSRGVSLVVPEMENVGMLRQTPTPKESVSYWVVFSNKGRLVKRGDRVDVLIGNFHANNLVVD